ncbi:MAG: hypothetical protein ACSI46_23640 [Gloeotrichia echinulata DVL01]|jgi:hypothetical protein|nr:hypothetical protein [Gloeotrichia echinulata DEX184]
MFKNQIGLLLQLVFIPWLKYKKRNCVTVWVFQHFPDNSRKADAGVAADWIMGILLKYAG